MKLKLSLAAAAIGMAFAGQASALTVPTVAPGNGSLFLSVWDSSATGTFGWVSDTGLLMRDFLPSNVTLGVDDGGTVGTRTPEAGLTLTFNTGLTSALQSFTGNAADLRWNVVAADAQNGSFPTTQTNVRNLVTTTQVGTTLSTTPLGQTVLGTMTNSNLTTVTNNVGATTNKLNLGSGLTGSTPCLNQTSCFNFDTSTVSTWLGGISFGDTLGNSNLSTSTGINGSLQMLFLGQDGIGNVSGSTNLRPDAVLFGNSANLATMMLGANGTLTYNLAEVPQVPVPAAVWLFGSGLLGLVGVARRRNNKA